MTVPQRGHRAHSPGANPDHHGELRRWGRGRTRSRAAVAGVDESSGDGGEEVSTDARSADSDRRRWQAAAAALLYEDLQSPCYDEIAFFVAFSKIVMRAKRELVVVDTAPTGHTVRLLDTAESFHRQLVPREPEAGQPKVITPLMTLRDPDLTKVLIVTLPETTPVIEAQALQDDLRRAGIEPFAWVINASLLAAHPTDPVLQQRANAEVPLIRRVTDELAHRVALMPFQVSEPSGPERLRELLAPRQSTTSHLGVRSS